MKMWRVAPTNCGKNHGQPEGREVEIWLEAERTLAAKADSTEATSETSATSTQRLKAEMAGESETEFHLTPPVSEQAAIKAALQTQEGRAAPASRKAKTARAS